MSIIAVIALSTPLSRLRDRCQYALKALEFDVEEGRVLIEIGGLSGSSRKTFRSCMTRSLSYRWDELSHEWRLIVDCFHG